MKMLRKILFQTHWLFGISAGLVLAVIGLTGSLLSFEGELLRWSNPGVVTVAPRTTAPLAADALVSQLAQTQPHERVTMLNLSAEPTDAARVTFAVPGSRRGKTVHVDPYTGDVLGQPRGEDFFHLVEDIHRKLAAGDNGKAITGASTLCLVFLCLSGLYLRWPRRVSQWRAWLTFNPRLSGRAFLWGLHSVAGTYALICLLVAALTGLFWSYDWYRDGLHALTGTPRPESREGAPGAMAQAGGASRRADKVVPPYLASAWSTFTAAAPTWRSANLRLPERPGQALQINYLDAGATHDRARSRLQIDPASGEIRRHDRYADLPAGARLIASMFALHGGSFFGLPGRLLMMLASLCLPLFAITGWIMYLDRRRRKRAARAEHQQQGSTAAGEQPWLVG